nr:MAG TPA: periodic tryptophan protein 2-like protein [Caudoviricetes sp.]
MESLTLEQNILVFLNPSDGSGSGSGYGYGSGSGGGNGSGSGSGGGGNGSGYGYGKGSGGGYGDSSGYGDGYGYGNGAGIKAINGQQVYMVDGISTLIDVCHETYAMGRILHSDLTTEKCFIVKQDGKFAHGETLREARDALLEKLFDDMPEEERIEKFMESHDLHERYPNRDFFSWHHRLTGSCLQGRTAFAQDHEIDLDGSMTTKEFLELTKDSYGGDIIRRTIKAYEA